MSTSQWHCLDSPLSHWTEFLPIRNPVMELTIQSLARATLGGCHWNISWASCTWYDCLGLISTRCSLFQWLWNISNDQESLTAEIPSSFRKNNPHFFFWQDWPRLAAIALVKLQNMHTCLLDGWNTIRAYQSKQKPTPNYKLTDCFATVARTSSVCRNWAATVIFSTRDTK